MQTLDEMIADYDAERIREIERQEALDRRPERIRALAHKKALERAREVLNRHCWVRTGRAPLSTWGIA